MQSSYCVARYAVNAYENGPCERIARTVETDCERRSEHALGDHGVGGDLDEAGGVGAEHQIALMAVLLGGGQELATMFSMMDLSLLSTSSNVQERR